MPKTNRRKFIRSFAAVAAAGAGPGVGARPRTAIDTSDRKSRVYDMRVSASNYFRGMPDGVHESNGDEERYADKRNSYTKCLPHDQLGNVQPDAWDSLMRAAISGRSEDYENIAMGGQLKLKNPQATHSYAMEGLDSYQFRLKPAPKFDSAELAGEMVELYWHALARDVPFAEYETNRTIHDAAEDLSRLSDFRGPKVNGRVTPQTIFRGDLPGAMTGPYISQFLLLPIAAGATRYDQKVRAVAPRLDYLTNYATWLDTQRGIVSKADRADPPGRYIRSGRDMAEWVHRDFSFQGALNTTLILLDIGGAGRGGLEVVRIFSDNNVLLYSKNQEGFVTWGAADIIDLIGRVCKFAFQAAWFQKWQVHRRARPEAIAGRLHNHLTGASRYDLHEDLLNAPVLSTVRANQGSYLLSQAWSDGAPTHPAYPSGHAIITGACVTVLKAFFREDFVIPNPVVASPDGLDLRPYTGEPLTVMGELHKLVSNIAFGRDWAGIHYRSDLAEGWKLGEEVAIQALRDFGKQYSEDFGGFAITRFDGTRITVCPSC